MNIKSVSTAICAALVGLSIGLPATAMADHERDRHYKRDHDRHERHYDRPYKFQKRHWKHHRKHDRKHARKHYRHNRRHHGYNAYHHYRDDDDHEKLLIGLVVGGILGYALNEHNDPEGERYYERNSHSQNSYPAEPAYRHNDGTCLQEREYQTTVIVGGREVDAYGTACLQPDGSWKRSPARLESF